MLDLARFEAAFAEMRRDKRVLNLSTLSLVAGSSYSHAFQAARRLGIEYVTEDELIQTSYRCAVILCANRDRDGLVTFEGIARERKVGMKTVYDFFKRHPELREESRVLDRVQVREARIRKAVAVLRKSEPDRKVTRQTLSGRLGWKAKTLMAYLANHSDLAEELGISYAYTNYGRKR